MKIFSQIDLPPAQAAEGEWQTYTVVDGLAGPDVTNIFQDSKGNMWFVTRDKGVSLFDRKNFISFAEKNDFLGDHTKQILEDKQGHLWFITARKSDQEKHGMIIRYDGKIFQQITKQDGLARGFSNAMLKDKNGNLWFANAYGLTKYDGSRFQQFGIKKLPQFVGAKERKSGRIQVIFESQNGDLWLGGGYDYDRKLPPFIIQYDGKDFHYFPLDSFPPSSTIYAIAEDDVGNLWFGGRYILCKYDGKSFERFDNEKPGTFSISYKEPLLPEEHSNYIAPTPLIDEDGGGNQGGSHRTSEIGNFEANFTIWLDSFFKDSHGKLWFNMAGYLFIWDGKQLQHFLSLNWDATKEPVAFDEKGQPCWFPGQAVFEDQLGNLWFRNVNGVHRYGGKSFQTFTVDDVGSDNISVIFEDKDGKFWFGHDNGVTVFDPAIQNFTTRRALGSNSVNLIHEDKNGFVWFSIAGGIARYNSEKLQYFSEKQMGPIKSINIVGVVDDGKDGLWFVGRSTSTIFRYKNGQFRLYNIYGRASGSSGAGPKFFSDSEGHLWLDFVTPESPIRGDGERFQSLTEDGWKEVPQGSIIVGRSPITDLLTDSKRNIWFASDKGIKKYEDGKLKTKLTTTDGLKSNNIQKIFEDKDGNLWFISELTTPDASPSQYAVYVSRYDGKSIQNFSIEPIHHQPLYKTTGINMHQDNRGILWFVGPQIGICRYDGTSFDQILTQDNPVAEIISGEDLRASITDRSGNLWLATSTGAIKYDGKQFHVYTAEDGFMVNDIRDVRKDRQGDIWFATWGGGVVRYNGETFQAITTKHGLVHNNVKSIFEDSRGYLWFATNGGITKYTPRGIELPPQIKLTKVTAYKVYTDFEEVLQLPAKARRLTFEYQGSSLKDAKLLYTHKLIGYDKDWSQPSPENRVEYKGLKPGRYVFLVKAIREDLEYANPPASIEFTILSPSRTITKLTKRLLSTEERVRQRTAELQQTQAQLIQAEKMATVGTLAGGVAHEINNPLDAILGSVQRILRLSADPKVVESAQSAQEGTRRCKEIVEKLLKYSRQSRDELTSLEVNQVVEDTVALLEHQLKLENISLNMQLSPGLKVQGNFNELSQVITNLLTNAKDAIVTARSMGKDAGIITIRTADENDKVLIEVSDNGIGIEEQHLGKLFDPFFTTKPVGKGTGLGLSICQGIIEKHHGRIEVSSKVGEGATFRVFLPIAESS